MGIGKNKLKSRWGIVKVSSVFQEELKVLQK
jgi:hypothetical protein